MSQQQEGYCDNREMQTGEQFEWGRHLLFSPVAYSRRYCPVGGTLGGAGRVCEAGQKTQCLEMSALVTAYREKQLEGDRHLCFHL